MGAVWRGMWKARWGGAGCGDEEAGARARGEGCAGARDAGKGRLGGGPRGAGPWTPSARSCLALARGRLLTGALKNNFLSINVNKSLDPSSK